MDVRSPYPSLTICICTVDRPEILRRCLESIAKGTSQPDAIFVSDDSKDSPDTKTLCREFPAVTYMRGPRKGLCSNRNRVVQQTTTDYVSLMDDDAVLSDSFVAIARALVTKYQDNVIITGIINEDGVQVMPSNPSFLGHFKKLPKKRFETVNLNCNIFPRRAFDEANFDEAIAYGYEDMDICSHLLSSGFSIVFEPQLQNAHRPPARNASAQKVNFLRTQKARFYTSVKRYMLWNKDYVRLAAYLVVAPIHRAIYAIRVGFWFDLKHCVPDIIAAFQDALRERARLRSRALPGCK